MTYSRLLRAIHYNRNYTIIESIKFPRNFPISIGFTINLCVGKLS